MLVWQKNLSRLCQSKIPLRRNFSVKAQIPNLARVYADVNELKGPEHWSYETYPLTYGTLADYKLGTLLGSGKYSEVFEAVHTEKHNNYIVKVLKAPKTPAVVQREVKILRILSEGPNISKLVDVVKDPDPSSTAVGLVFEATPCVDIKKNYKRFTDADIRYYMYQILRALEFAHSHGIMHRDVKMGNILVDPTTKMLRLIDWGLAEFYHPGKEYPVRVATRHYKGPELLVNVKDYDYSLDMWSLGCTFTGLLFQKSPFFPGKDNDDQLMKFVKAMGTPNFWKWIDKYHIPMDPTIRMMVTGMPKTDWKAYETSMNYHLHSPEAFDLLDRLLQYEPRVCHHNRDLSQPPRLPRTTPKRSFHNRSKKTKARITAREAMDHPYFASVIKDIK